MTTAELATLHATEPRTRTAEVKRTLLLTWTLAVTDWRLRFYGSALGVLWTLIRPFAMFGVIYLVFTEVAHLDDNVKHYGVYILFAMVLFQFFMEVTAGSVQSLVAREGLLRKIHFNPIVVPLAVAVTALLNLGMTIIAVLIFALSNGVYPDWTWLELPVIVAFVFLLSVGVAMLLSSLYVRFRDIQPIWDVFGQALFYASPVLYVATTMPEHVSVWFLHDIPFQRAMLCNPLSAAFTQMRHAVVDPTAPSLTHLFGADLRALIPLGIAAAVFALGLRVFVRAAPDVAENL